jgi:hypothetical protein
MATRDELLFARPHGMGLRNDLVQRDESPFLGRVRERRRCPRLSLSLEDEGDLTADTPEDPCDDKPDQEREGNQRPRPDRDPHPNRHLAATSSGRHQSSFPSGLLPNEGGTGGLAVISSAIPTTS